MTAYSSGQLLVEIGCKLNAEVIKLVTLKKMMLNMLMSVKNIVKNGGITGFKRGKMESIWMVLSKLHKN